MQRLKIDVTKIDKSALFAGSKGTYVDITLLDNRDGTDQYGNDGMIVQDIGQQRREAGEKGPILGNWKWLKANNGQAAPANAAQPTPQPEPEDDSSDVPF
jgi:hypothetical protein